MTNRAMVWLTCAALSFGATFSARADSTPAATEPVTEQTVQSQDTAQGQNTPPADPCAVPEHLTHVDGKLPHVAATAKDKTVDILVEGTGSSMLPGADGTKNAYPARLEAALAARLPGVKITIRTDVKTRRTTAEMAKVLAAIPASERPRLVIWQAGTVDAMRGIDPDEFRAVLEKSVRKLQANGIDVLLMNMQYSPRTEMMVTVGPYAEAMRWVAQQTDAPLFDRFAAMKYWSETGVFDFSEFGRSKLAETVHDCIGKLLAEVIIESAGLANK